MITNRPLVSIVMGTYNGERTIDRAIQSILIQSYTNFELIICDDCSTDRTFEILNHYKETDSRVKIIRNSKNCGLSVSLNKCIQVSEGDFIARMDDDDISHSTRIQTQVDFLNANPQYAIVGTRRNLFDGKGVWGKTREIITPTKIDIFKGKGFAHPTVIIRKEALESVGFYSEDRINRRGQDYDLWCKLYHKGYKGYNLDIVLFDYYESSSSIKRRKIGHRINSFIKKTQWRKKLGLPFWYTIYAYKELAGLLISRKAIHILRRTRHE